MLKTFFNLAIIISFLVSSVNYQAEACTAFLLQSPDSVVVGKNYDWYWGHGHGVIFVNQRGKKKQALKVKDVAKPAQWVSKYGSLTFTQFGKNLPVSGMNEKGLVVEMLQLDDSIYNSQQAELAFVNESEWTQYQLDSFATTAEVVANAQNLRIQPAFTGIHYFICDPTSQCAVVEFLDGKVNVFTGENLPIPALTNNTYKESMQFAAVHYSKQRISFDKHSRTSLNRFLTATSFLQNEKSLQSATLVDKSFELLNSVRLNGIKSEAWLYMSQWNMVHDLTKKQITFRTRSHETLKSVSINEFDFSCQKDSLMADMNSKSTGAIRNSFFKFSPEANKKVVDRNRLLLGKELREIAARAAYEICE